REIGQGTGLNNMSRQLGGSFGIAALTTLIHVRQGLHRNNLLTNINEYNPAFTDRLNMMIHSFQSKGYGLMDATKAAYRAIEGTITRQAMLLTYDDAYWLVAVIMLLAIPLLYLQKFKKNVEMPADAH
ncbi:MAG: MFS transporter, partial [Mucilaginibacter polytrichastri]|nr:MFS transporter [Mucilaginibacter polytrichastri]